MCKKKIAYLLEAYPVYSETFVQNELLELQSYNVKLSIYAMKINVRNDDISQTTGAPMVIKRLQNDYNLSQKIRALGYLMLRNPFRVGKSYTLVKSWKDANALACWKSALFTAAQLKRQGIGHIHSHFANQTAEVAMLVSLLSGIPYSFTGHGRDVFCNRRLLEQKINHAKFVVVVADYMKTYLTHYYPCINKKKLHKVIMGVNPDYFNSQVEAAHDNNGHFDMVCVARLEQKKGLCYLIEALSLLRKMGTDATLEIIGDGSLMAELRILVEERRLDDFCQLPGVRTPKYVRQRIQKSDVFVLPCVVAPDGDRDSMPVAIKEAMAMGKPIVATKEVAIPEMVKDGSGILVPPRDSHALANALYVVKQMSEKQRQAMGKIGRGIVEQEFRIDRQVSILADLYGLEKRN